MFELCKEELEKEAIFHAENIIPADVNYYLTKKYSKEQIQQAYIAGAEPREKRIADLEKENAELKELIEKYRQAVDKCLHITFMGGGREVSTIGQYATLVDGYLTDVEGLAKLFL